MARRKSVTEKKPNVRKKRRKEPQTPPVPSQRKNNIKKQGKNETLSAIIMVFVGIFISLSLNTASMGIVGKGIRFLLLGIFGKIALLISIGMIILGAIKLLYHNRFTFQDIPKGLFPLLLLDLSLFYAKINSSILPKGEYRWSNVGRVFMDSADNLGVGVIPYSFVYLFHRFLGVWGTTFFIFAITLFIIWFYFGFGPLQMIEETGGAVKGCRTFVDMIKEKINNLIFEDLPDEEDDEEHSTFLDYGNFDKDFDYSSYEDYQLKPLTKESYMEQEKRENLFKVFFGKNDNEDFSINNPLEKEEESLYQEEPYVLDKTDFGDDASSQFKYNNLEEIVYRKDRFDYPVSVQDNDELATLKEESEVTPILKEERQTKLQKEYILPPYWLLETYTKLQRKNSDIQNKAKLVEDTLKIFSVEANVVNVSSGPTITRFELQPKPGTKVSKILSLSDDLSLALAAQSIRIEAPIPGKSLVGIEVSNEETEMVGFKSVVTDEIFRNESSKVSFVLGKDVAGKTKISNLVKMPHLLVAGSTGSGKSVCINTLICSILYRATPDEVKFIMIDPKMVELSVYNGIPHLMMPVVTDMKKAPYALSWAVDEMNRRYKTFAENLIKDIDGYNKKNPEEKMPSIVIIVDELADLMLVSPKEVEDSICRLAQMARACGIHLVIATQRPSVDVITGLIKANIPSRIAFAVSSQTDSRTILDIGGAEKLLGKGDMLYYPIGMSKPLRVQGAFISEQEVINIVSFIKEQNSPSKEEEQEEKEDVALQIQEKMQQQLQEEEIDDLYQDIVKFAIENGKVSTSLIQRKFRIGYNRASRIMDYMEEQGIVAASDGVRPRNVLVDGNSTLRGNNDGNELE